MNTQGGRHTYIQRDHLLASSQVRKIGLHDMTQFMCSFPVH